MRHQLKITTLLDKPEDASLKWGRLYHVSNSKWIVVGYGLDYVENYRNLPYVGILKEERDIYKIKGLLYINEK